MLKKNEIYRFKEIGYSHQDFSNLPSMYPFKCSFNQTIKYLFSVNNICQNKWDKFYST